MDLTDRPPAGPPWPATAPPAAEEQMAAGRRAGVRPGRLSCADKVPFGSMKELSACRGTSANL